MSIPQITLCVVDVTSYCQFYICQKSGRCLFQSQHTNIFSNVEITLKISTTETRSSSGWNEKVGREESCGEFWNHGGLFTAEFHQSRLYCGRTSPSLFPDLVSVSQPGTHNEVSTATVAQRVDSNPKAWWGSAPHKCPFLVTLGRSASVKRPLVCGIQFCFSLGRRLKSLNSFINPHGNQYLKDFKSSILPDLFF